MAEYRRGSGPQQLPQGGAKAANDALNPVDIPVNYATTKDRVAPVADQTLSDNTQILIAPPHPNYQGPSSPAPLQVPAYVVRHLPRLMAAAKDPDAPVTLKALYRTIIAQLDAQQAAL